MIKAEMIAASQHPFTGVKIATMKVVMPRYILAEFNTHRVFSRNSASSRAIPVSKTLRSISDSPYTPSMWMKEHKGMQGNEFITDQVSTTIREGIWKRAKSEAIQAAFDLTTGLYWDGKSEIHIEDDMYGPWTQKMGIRIGQYGESSMLYPDGEPVSKQIANRLLEPFMYHTVLVTATEWENFFNQRCPQYYIPSVEGEPFHNVFFRSRKELIETLTNTTLGNFEGTIDTAKVMSEVDWALHNKGQADFNMRYLAEAMYDCYREAEFKVLQPGDWHIPYGDQINGGELIAAYEKEYGEVLHTGNLYQFLIKRVSIARCARLSYQTLGENPKIDYLSDIKLFDSLFQNLHLSPFEHVARVMTEWEYETFIKTIIIDDQPVQQRGWCANFNSFIQYRSLIENKP